MQNVLGVIIDNKLNWLEHIKCISRKIAKGTGIIIKARKSFESETLLNLYNALILPHISYWVHIWGTTASIHLQRLYVLQKKIVRIICGVHTRTHTEPSYKALHVLDVEQIRDYSIALFMYKLTNCMLSSMFKNMFISTSNVHDYSTSQANLLYVQYASTKRSQRTIKHFGTKLWDSLSNVIDIDCGISTYKQRLKDFLLSWSLPILYHIVYHYFVFILSLLSSLICSISIIFLTVFSYVFLQFSKLYALFLEPCTLFSSSSHIYESYCIHELGTHTYLLLPPLPKLWYHCACFPTLTFIILSWSCMIDAPICVILAMNIFHCHSLS